MTETYNKKKVAIFSIHTAPYRDPVYAALYKKYQEEYDISFYTYFDIDSGHPYQEKGSYYYPNHIMSITKKYKSGKVWHKEVKSILKTGNFDAVLIPGYEHITSKYIYLYCLLQGISIIFNGDLVLFKKRKYVKQLLFNILEKVFLRNIKSAWIPGNATKEFLIQYGVSTDKIFQGSYCIDVEHLKNQMEKALPVRNELRMQFDLGNSDVCFMFAGRMIPVRGLEYLADAFMKLSLEFNNAYLLIIGQGELREKIENQLKCNKNAHFMDMLPITEICNYYIMSDVYILSSTMETYSLALAQAALASLPLIATDHVGATNDYIIEGENGFIVPACSSEDLYTAMKKIMMMSINERKNFGSKGKLLSGARDVSWATEELHNAIIKAFLANGEQK